MEKTACAFPYCLGNGVCAWLSPTTGGCPGRSLRLAHWPFALPDTKFKLPPESPICGFGLFSVQFRLRPMELVAISLPSGSAVTLLCQLIFPLMVSRKAPSQQDCHPEIVRLFPIVMSSKSP